MNKIFSIVLAALFTSCASVHAQEIDLEVEYLFTVGENLEFGEPGYLIFPHRIATDSDGHIFVSDRRQNVIFQYSPDGNFVRQIGRSGRGPGEFNEITALAVDYEDRLLVLDRMQFKVSRFNLSDDSVEEHLFEDLRQYNMMTLEALPGEQFAGIYVETPFPEDEEMEDGGGVRIYKFGESKKSASFFDYFTYQFDESVAIEQHMGRGIGHLLGVLNENQVVAGHRVYYGFHHLVNIFSGEVSRFENPEIQPPYYVNIGIEERPESFDERFAGAISAFGQIGSFYYQILYMSMKISGINGRLFHIYRKNEERGFRSRDYLEVFEPGSALIFHGDISDHIPKKEFVTARYYAYLDKKQRLFVVDHSDEDDPKISVHRIILEGL